MEEFTSETLTIRRPLELMDQFVGCVEDGTRKGEGWPNTCYGMSKLGVIALTRVMARERPGTMINSVDPGYCRTDQNTTSPVIIGTELRNDFVTTSQLLRNNFTDFTRYHKHARVRFLREKG